jgi:hypothetical protein
VRVISGIAAAVLLSGCSMTMPSFYDDNESMLAVDIRLAVANLDCNKEAKAQVIPIYQAVNRLSLYSDSKGSDDIGEMVTLLSKTTRGILEKQNVSPAFCNIKKKVLLKQSEDVATAIMGRY